MYKVTAVKVLADYRLDLTFDDGTRGIVDYSTYLDRGVFTLWRDPAVFAQVRIGDHGGLQWGEDLEICPDSLYLKVTGKTPEELFPALRPDTANV
jgi:hypothetical protein